MKYCDINPETLSCPICGGRVSRLGVKRKCARDPGLGDMFAAGLDAVGITKDRVQAAASLVGIDDCGCSQRQQIANELGYKLGIGTPPAEGQPEEVK